MYHFFFKDYRPFLIEVPFTKIESYVTKNQTSGGVLFYLITSNYELCYELCFYCCLHGLNLNVLK